MTSAVVCFNIVSMVTDTVDVDTVMDILRNEEGSVNFVGELLTMGSQVSVLQPCTSGRPCCHWFTATPNTRYSVFKPFIFCDAPKLCKWTVSSASAERPRATFQSSIDRRHALYRAHERGLLLMESGTSAGSQLHGTLRQLEGQCVREVMDFVRSYRDTDAGETRDLFSDIVESEIKFYS